MILILLSFGLSFVRFFFSIVHVKLYIIYLYAYASTRWWWCRHICDTQCTGPISQRRSRVSRCRDDRIPRSRSSDTASLNRNSVHGVLRSNSPTVSPAHVTYPYSIYYRLVFRWPKWPYYFNMWRVRQFRLFHGQIKYNL